MMLDDALYGRPAIRSDAAIAHSAPASARSMTSARSTASARSFPFCDCEPSAAFKSCIRSPIRGTKRGPVLARRSDMSIGIDCSSFRSSARRSLRRTREKQKWRSSAA
eukprot:322942-Prymnesium_polylepis.1